MYQLVVAKSNSSMELLLLAGNKIVSRWPYDSSDASLKEIGDLSHWDNQAASGADLSDYQADLDSGALKITKVL